MKTKITIHIWVLICAFSFPYVTACQSIPKETTLTNNDVISMIHSGLTSSIVKSSIGRSKTNFDLSPNGLIQLKKSGLPEDILLAMLSKSNADGTTPPKDSLFSLPAGIYYKSSGNYRRMVPGILICEPAKGVGAALKKTIRGFINITVKASIAGQHAELNIEEAKPVYLFILDFPARSPEEFFLVRLMPANASRQISFQKAANASVPIMVNDSLKINFSSKRINSDIYEVSPNHPLPVGEYCFMYSASSFYPGTRFKVFDFTLQGKP